MKILIDIGHPAHVHLFKNVIKDLKEKGHEIFITTKEKKSIKQLLEANGLHYTIIGKKGNGIIQKVFKQFYFTFKTLNLFYKYKIDLSIGVSISISQAGLFTKTKSIVLDDDDIAATPYFAILSHTFADIVISPVILKAERDRKKDIFHYSYHELAYLHPNRFVPNPKILDELNINKDEFFSIVRFSALKAHHDVNEIGISDLQAFKVVNILETKGKVFITSEKKLPAALGKYTLHIGSEKFHDILSFASLLVCDSQTVAAEAAVLGVPSVRINTFVGRISYLSELGKRYQLTFGFKPSDFDKAIDKIHEITSVGKEIFQERRKKMLSEKIDLTAFLVWFIENYPNSVKIMKQNPDYQYNFK